MSRADEQSPTARPGSPGEVAPGGGGSAVDDTGREAGPAPRPAGGGWRAVFGYWFAVYKRIWRSTVISSFLAPLLYLAGMGYGLGALIDSGDRTAVPGVPYVAFVATGLVAAQAMMTASAETTYNVFGAIKWLHTYDAMLVTPLRVVDLVRGHLVYVLMRLTLVAGVFVGVALALRAMDGPLALAAVPAAVLGGLAFATPIYAFSATLDSEQGFNVLQRFIIMPLFLFSGTFFPLAQLPVALQVFGWVSPLTHTVALTRALGLGPDSALWIEPWRFAVHVAYLVLWAGVGYLLAVRALRRRMVV
ncbi:ABC transporter permease [Occultella kanbiaonis]|uniref:ABC transporter permease n=1 Tax=Occultella kanbiaonis TaxID=2675754 RepID=UPI001A993058|nr:ABC transporter permease [Occultella kanbiaonis]